MENKEFYVSVTGHFNNWKLSDVSSTGENVEIHTKHLYLVLPKQDAVELAQAILGVVK